jgi:hypothetical protein
MSYLRLAGITEDYGNHIETKRALVDIVRCQKIPCSPNRTRFLNFGDGIFCCAEGFVAAGLNLHKDNAPIAVDHDKIDFSALAREIPRQQPHSFVLEESQAAFFTPSPEQLGIG